MKFNGSDPVVVAHGRVLYHCVSARCFRPRWMLEELGLAYDLRVMPFPPRVYAEQYKAVNPLGTIPLYLEGEVRMTESMAICQYLCERHSAAGFGVAAGDPAYADYLNFVHFGAAALTFPLALLLRSGRLEPVPRREPQVVRDYSDWFLGRLRTLDARLAENAWLCAGRFTAADVSVGYALLLATFLDLAPQFPPHVAAYAARRQWRPAYQAALEAERQAAMAQGVDPRPAPLALQA